VEERKSWGVKDKAIKAELVELLELSADEKTLLASLKEAASQQAPIMVEAFYARLFASENTKEYFEGATMERLHSMIATWFTDLFSGDYDTAYVEQRLYIGNVHVKIGLPVRYPIAMLDIVSQHGLEVARQSSDSSKAEKAFLKVLSLDVAIFNQAYEDNQLSHLADLVGGERLARLLLSGESM